MEGFSWELYELIRLRFILVPLRAKSMRSGIERGREGRRTSEGVRAKGFKGASFYKDPRTEAEKKKKHDSQRYMFISFRLCWNRDW